MKSTKRVPKSTALAQEAIASRNQLEQWLKKHIPDADLDQEKYTDGMLVAKILDNIYPGLINVEQIREPTSLTNKIKMWKYLNELALINLGIRLQEWELLKIARGTQNCIEKLLRKLMEVENKKVPLKPASHPPILPKVLKRSTPSVEQIPPSEPVKVSNQMPKQESVKINDCDAVTEKIAKYVEQFGMETDLALEKLIKNIEALSS